MWIFLAEKRGHREIKQCATSLSLMQIAMVNSSVVLFLLGTFIIPTRTNDVCPRIISRSQWQARAETGHNYLITPLLYVVIHHTVTPQCQSMSSCSARVRNIQEYHMDTFDWADVGFSFFIGGDGNVYEGVGWTKEGAHTYHWNKKSIGVAFIGNFARENASQPMIDAARKLISCGKAQNMLRPNVKVIGASQVTATASPGRKLFAQIEQWPEFLADPLT